VFKICGELVSVSRLWVAVMTMTIQAKMAGKSSTIARADNMHMYPENAQQMEMITASAMRCGFTGGMVVDFPNSTKVIQTDFSYHPSFITTSLTSASSGQEKLPCSYDWPPNCSATSNR
jgi:hypothetical protein